MSALLQPGAHPPVIVPYCSFCELPVEELKLDAITSPYYLGIHGNCCGHANSVRLPVDEVFRLRRTNEKFFLIVPRRRGQAVRALRSRA